MAYTAKVEELSTFEPVVASRRNVAAAPVAARPSCRGAVSPNYCLRHRAQQLFGLDLDYGQSPIIFPDTVCSPQAPIVRAKSGGRRSLVLFDEKIPLTEKFIAGDIRLCCLYPFPLF